jgi:hypothetical protein
MEIPARGHGFGRAQHITARRGPNEPAFQRAEERFDFMVGLHLRVGACEHRGKRLRGLALPER